jgi:capsular exopolysaccharide synthesis family protein
VPVKPVSPNIPRNLGLGLGLGIVLGAAAAFLAEDFDDTIRTPEQAQLITGLPVLSVVPLRRSAFPPGHQQHRPARQNAPLLDLISQHEPQSPLAESYRSLRTSILLSSAGMSPAVLLVTSSLPQEGKSTTAINIATVLAQTGTRVLLVDADLRRPVVHSRFGVSPGPGLSTLLSGGCVDEEAILPSSVPNLSILPAGPNPPRPAELLGSQELAGHLAKWRREYGHVVFDSCPVLSVTDAVLLSVLADSVMLVVRSESTTRDDLRRARDLLLHVNANLLGLVVNAADLRGPEYRSYARHYQYYAENK